MLPTYSSLSIHQDTYNGSFHLERLKVGRSTATLGETVQSVASTTSSLHGNRTSTSYLEMPVCEWEKNSLPWHQNCVLCWAYNLSRYRQQPWMSLVAAMTVPRATFCNETTSFSGAERAAQRQPPELIRESFLAEDHTHFSGDLDFRAKGWFNFG